MTLEIQKTTNNPTRKTGVTLASKKVHDYYDELEKQLAAANKTPSKHTIFPAEVARELSTENSSKH